MGIPVLILGASGSGKSTSLRNFEENEVGIMNVASKPLPFRKKLKCADNADYRLIVNVLNKHNLNCYVIDDSQYLLAFELFQNIDVKGYDKFTNLAVNFYNLIRFVQTNTPADCIVYFLHHTDTDANGKIKAKTVGKMLDEKLTVEGLFSIVLMCECDSSGRHYFVTQSNGGTTCKSPMDMFPAEMDNDLKLVDHTIREYYEL